MSNDNGAGRIVVTVQGIDRTGIVARVTTALAEARANLTDISQSVLHGNLFVMVAVAHLAPDGLSFDELRTRLAGIGEEMGIQVHVQREEIFHAMHRV